MRTPSKFVVCMLALAVSCGIVHALWTEECREGGSVPMIADQPPLEVNYGEHFPSRSELDRPSLIVMHMPEDEVRFGSLHPAGALYASPTTMEKARDAVSRLAEEIMEVTDAKVVMVKDVLEHMKHDDLVALAKQSVKYAYEGFDEDETARQARMESDYAILHTLPSSELVSHIINRPTIHLGPTDTNTGFVIKSIELHPLSNLVFTRDQQITTRSNVVLGSLNSPQRAPETVVMKSVWKELGVPLAEIPNDGSKLEGGDYMLLTNDISLLGVGLRTNMKAAKYMLDHDLFGTKHVILVVDEHDRNQDRMHLDTYFNIVDDKTVVLLDTLAGPKSPTRRNILEYERGADGKYILVEKTLNMEFSEWLKAMGYKIIMISDQQQKDYMINFLNLGPGKGSADTVHLLAVHPDLSAVIQLSSTEREAKNRVVHYIDYSGVTAMYGAAHCTTQVIRGTRPLCQNQKSEL